MSDSPLRRDFLVRSSLLSVACALPLSSRSQAATSTTQVSFTPEIERWVRMIERTEQSQLLEKLAEGIRDGQLNYQQLLSSLFLAGIRNVQPRPNVGFKFHAVLVVNSAHLASMACPDSERWLPLLWAADNFKTSQRRDVEEGDWTMPAVDDSQLPASHAAEAEFRKAMDAWDEQAADASIAAWSRTASQSELFDAMANYGSRDLRDIGHKAIYVANGFRTLEAMSWEFAEPILRSLTYALLCRNRDPNPSQSDLAADQPIRRNRERIAKVRDGWMFGKADARATDQLIASLHQTNPEEAGAMVFDMLQSGVSPQSIWDGMFVSATELLMRQPGIVALHAVTTTNAIAYCYRRVHSDALRLQLLLQNASFLGMFCERVRSGTNRSDRVSELLIASEPQDLPSQRDAAIAEILQSMGTDNDRSARLLHSLVENEPDAASEFIHRARQMVFLKGTDSHDYKFSSAIMEDYFNISPDFRSRYLAMSLYKLNSPAQRDTPLLPRLKSCLGIA